MTFAKDKISWRTNFSLIKRSRKLNSDPQRVQIQSSSSNGGIATWLQDAWKNALACGNFQIYMVHISVRVKSATE